MIYLVSEIGPRGLDSRLVVIFVASALASPRLWLSLWFDLVWANKGFDSSGLYLGVSVLCHTGYIPLSKDVCQAVQGESKLGCL